MLDRNDHRGLSLPPKVSVVVPCYNEKEVLPEFHRRMTASCAKSTGGSYEIILVDDGSKDDTWRTIQELADANGSTIGIRLFRNHGQQLAVTAGLAVARGERILLIDADLQDPPELLADMMAVIDGGADVVYGKRLSRAGESPAKLATAKLFYRFLNALSTTPIPSDTGDFRLMRREVADVLRSMPEQHRFVRGMVSWVGGRQVPLPYARDERFAGNTNYPLRKLILLAVDAITSFSVAPLRLAVWLGLSVGLMSLVVMAFAVEQWMRGAVVPGWASTIVLLALFSSIQFVLLGVIGEYLGRVMEEVKRRPLYVVGSLQRNGREIRLPTDFSIRTRAEQQRILDQAYDHGSTGGLQPAHPAV